MAPLLARHSAQTIVFAVVAVATGVLLLAGLWTPIAGSLAALLELRNALLHADPWICILLGALGLALAMIGPGAWSVDARLFGWKRVDTEGL